jgi:hypothetical protein
VHNRILPLRISNQVAERGTAFGSDRLHKRLLQSKQALGILEFSTISWSGRYSSQWHFVWHGLSFHHNPIFQ